MEILLVAATELEIKPFLKINEGIDVLITGIGIPATVYHLTKKIFQKKYEVIIQAGIGGSFKKNISLAEVVAVENDTFNIGIEEKENYVSIFNTGLADKNSFPFEDGWLKNRNEILKTTALKKVNGITVNTISDNEKSNNRFCDYYKADIESMEGGAFHYVCLNQKIPFLQIRGISNMVGERDKDKWAMKEAIENLNKEVQILAGVFKTNY